MIEKERATRLIQESLDSLVRSGLIPAPLHVEPGTVLLGGGSPMDSIAFVTFVTDLEERVSKAFGREAFLVLTEINEFNADNPSLTAGTLANYIVQLSK